MIIIIIGEDRPRGAPPHLVPLGARRLHNNHHNNVDNDK